ncbi:MAG: hypothetical protein JW830_07190 [Bacteroidales bacterium]|nr:hypothetical protein [Bacteroidales bacterium]
MPKKVLVVYYTQTGQLREIVKSVTAPLEADPEIHLAFEELKPRPLFPFPWTSDEFFQAMPECVKGIPCELEPLTVDAQEDFDLIIVAWQPWFLSPSIPFHAFFQLESTKKLLNGKPVITLIACRNMWYMAQTRIKQYIQEAGGRLAGNILLYDKAPNLLSLVSIIRWMFKGKRDRYMKIIPPAGVSQADIDGAIRYGLIIRESLQEAGFDNLQPKLVSAGAVDVRTGLVMIEKRGIVMFRLWAGFILKKGPYGAKSRLLRVRLFKYYLLAVLYLVSPFATLLYQIIKPFRGKTIKKQISLYQSA